MKPEIKAAWVAALRSGEFKQDFSRLKNGKGYCCLGVLSELALRSPDCPVNEWCSIDHEHDPTVCVAAEMWYLPNLVQRWAGLASSDPGVLVPHFTDGDGTYPAADGISGLARLNDNHISFSRIADLIEQDPDL